MNHAEDCHVLVRVHVIDGIFLAESDTNAGCQRAPVSPAFGIIQKGKETGLDLINKAVGQCV